MTSLRHRVSQHPLREELKTRATILRKELAHPERQRAEAAGRRVQRLPAFADLELAAALDRAQKLAHADALDVVAGELTYPGWDELCADLEVRAPRATAAFAEVLGRRLCPEGGGGFLNVWCRSYPEAARQRGQTGGVLLPYLRQFLVADPALVKTRGFSPDDADWQRIGMDWARPADLGAWRRLNAVWWSQQKS